MFQNISKVMNIYCKENYEIKEKPRQFKTNCFID